MAKIIETNLIFDDNNNLRDFQSRMIEVDSWEYVIDLFESDDSDDKIFYADYSYNMMGVLRPKGSKIENMKYTERKLMCDVIRSSSFGVSKTKKIIDLCKE